MPNISSIYVNDERILRDLDTHKSQMVGFLSRKTLKVWRIYDQNFQSLKQKWFATKCLVHIIFVKANLTKKCVDNLLKISFFVNLTTWKFQYNGCRPKILRFSLESWNHFVGLVRKSSFISHNFLISMLWFLSMFCLHSQLLGVRDLKSLSDWSFGSTLTFLQPIKLPKWVKWASRERI